jgi:hypothetical protein
MSKEIVEKIRHSFTEIQVDVSLLESVSSANKNARKVLANNCIDSMQKDLSELREVVNSQ